MNEIGNVEKTAKKLKLVKISKDNHQKISGWEKKIRHTGHLKFFLEEIII